MIKNDLNSCSNLLFDAFQLMIQAFQLFLIEHILLNCTVGAVFARKYTKQKRFLLLQHNVYSNTTIMHNTFHFEISLSQAHTLIIVIT